jgi:hypothetical protein
MLPAIKENKGKITNLDHRCIILWFIFDQYLFILSVSLFLPAIYFFFIWKTINWEFAHVFLSVHVWRDHFQNQINFCCFQKNTIESCNLKGSAFETRRQLTCQSFSWIYQLRVTWTHRHLLWQMKLGGERNNLSPLWNTWDKRFWTSLL